jgi:uncharacterized protein (DUF885 family)
MKIKNRAFAAPFLVPLGRLLVLSILIVGAAGFAVGEKKPTDIEAVFDGYFREIIARNPELATEIGLTREMGYPLAQDRLNDVSEKAARQEFEINRKYLKLLKSSDRTRWTASQKVAADVLIWVIEDILRGEPFWWNRYVIDHMNGAHSYLTNLMTELHPLASLKDGEDYCARLEDYGRRFGQLLETLAIQERKGIIPPKVVVEKVRSEMADFISPEAAKNILATNLAEKLARLKDLPAEDIAKLAGRAERAVRDIVYPIYNKFIDRLKEISVTAKDDMGVWKLPDGDRYYEYCLRSYTSTSLTPDEIHRLGLKEIERLQKEMIAVIRSLGIQDGKTFPEIFNAYRTQVRNLPPDQYAFPATPAGREAALQEYQRIIDDVTAQVPRFFSLIPKAGVRAQRVPEFQERTMTSNYMAASLDGKRQGVFYVNPRHMAFRPSFKTLTYHEAVPGHHFQIALERESPDYRIYRSLFFLSGFGEGWALYVEQLGREFGWYDNPYTLMGYLASDMGRAMRLVVDTGLHFKRWTRDQALQFQSENTTGPSPFEVDRYSVFPGQACSYMVGKLKILELRARAEAALGSKFDLKEFHKVLLEHGASPLEMVEVFVDTYIKGTK